MKESTESYEATLWHVYFITFKRMFFYWYVDILRGVSLTNIANLLKATVHVSDPVYDDAICVTKEKENQWHAYFITSKRMFSCWCVVTGFQINCRHVTCERMLVSVLWCDSSRYVRKNVGKCFMTWFRRNVVSCPREYSSIYYNVIHLKSLLSHLSYVGKNVC